MPVAMLPSDTEFHEDASLTHPVSEPVQKKKRRCWFFIKLETLRCFCISSRLKRLRHQTVTSVCCSSSLTSLRQEHCCTVSKIKFKKNTSRKQTSFFLLNLAFPPDLIDFISDSCLSEPLCSRRSQNNKTKKIHGSAEE